MKDHVLPAESGWKSGQSSAEFNFSAKMQALCADMTSRIISLHHIDMRRVAVSFCQTRKGGLYGLYAALTPMRFESGDLVTTRYGRRFTCQRLYDEQGQEFLYILSFYLPRFLNLAFEEKLTTILHELWHVSPQFDGDIRRHPGRCYVHSHSQRQYDAHMEVLMHRWLALSPPAHLYEFLHMNFGQLERQYGSICGTKIQHPKLIPLDASNEQ